MLWSTLTIFPKVPKITMHGKLDGFSKAIENNAKMVGQNSKFQMCFHHAQYMAHPDKCGIIEVTLHKKGTG